MVLLDEAVSSIKACEGVFRASDVARHFNVHRSTITRIWHGQIHRHVSPAPDFPEIPTRPRGTDLYEEIKTLLARGRSIDEVVEDLNVSKSLVYQVRGVWV